MKWRCREFCFDGETQFDNPSSTLLLWGTRFSNFWPNSGSLEPMVLFLEEERLAMERFRGMEVDRDSLERPSRNSRDDPAGFLFQLGYLRPPSAGDRLRPPSANETLALDCSNREIGGALARRLSAGYFGIADEACLIERDLFKALSRRDPAGLAGPAQRAFGQASWRRPPSGPERGI